MMITTLTVWQDVCESGEPIFIMGYMKVLHHDHVKYPFLTQVAAERLLENVMTDLEGSRGPISATEECMITKDMCGGLTTQTCGIISKHPYHNREG